jgi:hypothetical protein
VQAVPKTNHLRAVARRIVAAVRALLPLILISAHPLPTRALEAGPTSVVPYVTLLGEADDHRTYVIHYFTTDSVESILISGPRSSDLESIKNAEAVQHAKADDRAYFSERGAQLQLFRGKRAGTIDYTKTVNYRGTFHRHRIRVRIGGTFAYLIYDGHGLEGPYELRVASGDSFRAVHLGHTRGDYVPDQGPLITYSGRQIEQVAALQPELLLHSGDIVLSIYDWHAAYRETIEAFRTILPSTPLLIAASNHDQGWPASEHGFRLTSSFFEYFLYYPYAGSTLNYMVDHDGYRFLVVNYLDYGHRAESLEGMLRTWITGSPHPVVIVWGGSLHADRLTAFVREFPKVRLVLGGDGGGYRKQRLSHGAYLIHNQELLISLMFTPRAIVAEVRDDDGRVRDSETVSAIPSQAASD